MSNTSQGLDVGKMALEGFGQVMDSMDLVKRAWSNFSLATPFTPTLNVEELDKRIIELRAVEQWLSLNQNMLRNTIQGLEVQRGTLDAINTVSQSFGMMAKPADDAMAQTLARFAAAAAQKAASPADTAGAGGPAAPAASFDWSPFGMPSSTFTRPQASPTQSSPAPADATPHAAGESGDEEAAPDAPAATAAAPQTTPAGPQEPGQQAAAMNPMAWWEMLQANFRQIAQAATGAPAAGSEFAADGKAAGGQAADGKAAGRRPAGSAGKGASKRAAGKAAGSKAARKPKRAAAARTKAAGRTGASTSAGGAATGAADGPGKRRKGGGQKEPG